MHQTQTTNPSQGWNFGTETSLLLEFHMKEKWLRANHHLGGNNYKSTKAVYTLGLESNVYITNEVNAFTI